MNLHQYHELYSLLWFVIDLFAVVVTIFGFFMAVHGYSRTSRFVGFVLMISCVAVLVVGAAIAFELPFETVERFSDEYHKYVKEPEEPRRFLLKENVAAVGIAVLSLLGSLGLLISGTYARLKRWQRKKAALASA